MNLQKEMAKLPQTETDLKPPYWEYWRWQLWDLAQCNDPATFMRWPCVYHTMLHNHWRNAILQEYLQLPENIKQLIKAPKHCTDGLFNDADSLSLVHQLSNFHKWQEETGLKLSNLKTIYEFGGGFGQSVIAARRLGFTGKYYIYDLPEFALLQQWYLSENNTPATWLKRITKRKVDLLFASYSLSETDYGLRDKVINAVKAKSYLFLYSNKFEDYDNINYFQNLDLGKEWMHQRLDHLPPESWYSFGR